MTIDPTVIAELCRKHGITRLHAFGSYARGDFREGSDLDLLVEFDRALGLIEFTGVALDFEDRLGMPVDLVTEGGLTPRVRARILPDLRPLYDRAA
jgi:predicted nucleotidyltransferase